MICRVCKDRPVRFFEGRIYFQCSMCGPGRFSRAFEEKLRAALPQNADPFEWARYNQWASEQRTRNQKEQKP